jgi:hypothetical protein
LEGSGGWLWVETGITVASPFMQKACHCANSVIRHRQRPDDAAGAPTRHLAHQLRAAEALRALA